MSKSKVKTVGRRVLHRLFGSATRFREDRRGNVAIIVAAAIIPLVGALGLATDTSRGYLVKARLSQAIDAAGLAGGKVYFSATRNDDILKYFRVNFKTTATPAFGAPFNADFMEAEVTLDPPVEGGEEGNEWLRLSATATIPTTFMRVLGWDNVTVTAETEVTRVIKALDVVISLDMSGSMESPNDKIEAARDAAISFVDTVFGDNTESPIYTIDGEDYELLHIGFVPWNAKTRVTTQGVTSVTPVTTESVPTFTNPVTGLAQSEVYYANNSEVPLLVNPATLPGGWSGCIYARYLGDGSNDNDADVVRGPVTVGGAEWMAWEPMAVLDSEPRSGEWSATDGPAGTRWDDDNSWDNKQCTNAYFLDLGNNGNYDNADGTMKTSPSPWSSYNTSRPAAVPNPKWAPGTTYVDSGVTRQYSGAFRFIDPTQSYAEPGSTANTDSNPTWSDCTRCQTRGIIPLTKTKATIRDQLESITLSDPDGNTNIQQGLYWAWEVLMPGVPFDEAVPGTDIPFDRTQAIVLLTDGEQVGGAGDAYKGRFGEGEGAGQNDDSDHGEITYKGSDVQNNLDNRLRVLAENVKNEGIKLYVIGFDLEDNAEALAMLEEIASDPKEEYFFNAPNPEDLESIFKQIAASLTNLRLSM